MTEGKDRMYRITKRLILFMVVIMLAIGMMPPANMVAGQIKENIITCEDLYVKGYQIKTGYHDNGAPNVGFRTIAYAPVAGSRFMAGGKEYTVARTGIIYVLDDDCSGNGANKVLGDEYTLLNAASFQNDGISEYYTGIYTYGGANLTFGYLSTPLGYENNMNTSQTGQVYYARTLTDMEEFVANTIQMRVFVVATDGTIIYSQRTWNTSVMAVVYDLYVNGRMPTEEAHDYLYHNVLHSEIAEKIYQKNDKYPYYISGEVEYGWSSIVKPGFNK